MAGNEIALARYLYSRRGIIEFPHLGILRAIGLPDSSSCQFSEVQSLSELGVLATEDSRKKADIYINNHGISIKQSGGSFSYNRLQRANILDVYNYLGFSNAQSRLNRLDQEIDSFHRGLLDRRNRPWRDFFPQNDFKALLRYLMMQGSPNCGNSQHQAEYILEGPAHPVSDSGIRLFTFDEYFDEYVENFKIAIRRQWVGQSSNSEHNRAVSLASKPANAPWVYQGAVGTPRTGWRSSIPINERKTVYFLMIEKTA